MREADFQALGAYNNPGASPWVPVGVMRYDNPDVGDINGQKTQELSPEESQKAGLQEIL